MNTSQSPRQSWQPKRLTVTIAFAAMIGVFMAEIKTRSMVNALSERLDQLQNTPWHNTNTHWEPITDPKQIERANKLVEEIKSK